MAAMVENKTQKLTLYRPALYEIKVPGRLNSSWEEWDDKMTMTAQTEGDTEVTVLTGRLDQAALQGLLRQLYALGFPLISAIHIGDIDRTAWSKSDQDCH